MVVVIIGGGGCMHVVVVVVYTVCALNSAGFIFRRFSIFADFTFLNSWLLAIVPCVFIDV